VFTTTQNKAPRHRKVYPKSQACCKKAGIEIVTRAPDGREIEHVDIHSFRVTFATDLIVRGVDPKTVQELLGHQTLEMTMKTYTKIRGQRKRQGIGRLSYGSGAQAPGHVIELPQAAGWPGGTPPCPDETGALP
jgi:integrase